MRPSVAARRGDSGEVPWQDPDVAQRSSSSSRPTLEMVAALAGVSRGTASRVLSGATNVSPAAVAAVQKAAAELKYRPNLSARSLVTGRTGLVGLVVNESNDHLFSDPYFAEVARGAHDPRTTTAAGCRLRVRRSGARRRSEAPGPTDRAAWS